jgi:hypothetical protein
VKNTPTIDEIEILWKEHAGKMSKITKEPTGSKTNASKILIWNGAQHLKKWSQWH